MTNSTNWLILTLTLTCAALAGCGQDELGDEPGCGDDVIGDVMEEDGPGPDAGTSVDTPSGDAGTTGTDTGSTDTADAGTGGTTGTDAGSSDTGSADAGTGGSTGDAGTGGSDAGSGGSDAGTTTPAQPAPLRSPAACAMRFADAYIGGASCGQVRGNLPGTTWTYGHAIADTNADHELELTLTLAPAGTYELSYVSSACVGGPAVAETWASYGSRAQLLGMTEDARSFVSCNWWDAASGTTMTVTNPGCNLRISIDASCNVTGAGNMRNYR